MLSLLLCWAALDAPHKYHASLAQATYNSESASLEVALKLFSDDLEKALSRESKRHIVLDVDKDVEALTKSYVAQVFQLLGADNKALAQSWVGMEVGVHSTWVYFEIEVADMTGLRLHNSVFYELFEDQVNTVNVARGEKKGTLNFQTGDGPKPLPF